MDGISGQFQGPVAQARHQARSVHPYDGCRAQGPRAGVPPEGVRQRRHLFRRARRALLHGLRAFLHERSWKTACARSAQAKPDFIQEKNYFFRMSKVPAVACRRAQSAKIPTSSSERYPQRSAVDDRKRHWKACAFASENRAGWGIELPFDKDYVCYVWFDALLNYISAIGWPDGDKYAAYWPGEHLVAKDILKPHGVFWPTMLKSAGVPLYKHLNVRLLAHQGYQDVQSRSATWMNIKMAEHYGLDAFRYFLLRDMQFGSDASFSEEALITRFNADLANDLGNLVQPRAVHERQVFREQGSADGRTGRGRQGAHRTCGELRRNYVQLFGNIRFS